MPQNTVHVGARIPEDLYTKCSTKYKNMTAAIIAGLELLCKQEEDNRSTEENSRSTEENSRSTEENNNGELKALIEEKNNLIQELKESYQNRIDDLKGRNQFLEDQLKVKDDQIEKRDSDIKNLVAITTSQTYKAIEAPGAKKPWWRFW
jgi:hypothetical protein